MNTHKNTLADGAQQSQMPDGCLCSGVRWLKSFRGSTGAHTHTHPYTHIHTHWKHDIWIFHKSEDTLSCTISSKLRRLYYVKYFLALKSNWQASFVMFIRSNRFHGKKNVSRAPRVLKLRLFVQVTGISLQTVEEEQLTWQSIRSSSHREHLKNSIRLQVNILTNCSNTQMSTLLQFLKL